MHDGVDVHQAMEDKLETFQEVNHSNKQDDYDFID